MTFYVDRMNTAKKKGETKLFLLSNDHEMVNKTWP